MIKHVKWLAVLAALWALFGCCSVPKPTYHRGTLVLGEGKTKDGKAVPVWNIFWQTTPEKPAGWPY